MRKAMIYRYHKLGITRQANLLNVTRRAAYYQLQPFSPADLALMRKFDEVHSE